MLTFPVMSAKQAVAAKAENAAAAMDAVNRMVTPDEKSQKRTTVPAGHGLAENSCWLANRKAN
jgi:hypothetical protein